MLLTLTTCFNPLSLKVRINTTLYYKTFSPPQLTHFCTTNASPLILLKTVTWRQNNMEHTSSVCSENAQRYKLLHKIVYKDITNKRLNRLQASISA